MELLETQDPDKKRLIETSDRHKRALEKELSGLTEKTDRMLMNALIIGGSLAATYFVISSLSKKRKKKKKKAAMDAAAKSGIPSPQPTDQEEEAGVSILGEVGTKVLNMGAVMLLDIAREKISEYLATRNKPDEHS